MVWIGLDQKWIKKQHASILSSTSSACLTSQLHAVTTVANLTSWWLFVLLWLQLKGGKQSARDKSAAQHAAGLAHTAALAVVAEGGLPGLVAALAAGQQAAGDCLFAILERQLAEGAVAQVGWGGWVGWLAVCHPIPPGMGAGRGGCCSGGWVGSVCHPEIAQT
jgi:hypothetical protein